MNVWICLCSLSFTRWNVLISIFVSLVENTLDANTSNYHLWTHFAILRSANTALIEHTLNWHIHYAKLKENSNNAFIQNMFRSNYHYIYIIILHTFNTTVQYHMFKTWTNKSNLKTLSKLKHYIILKRALQKQKNLG